MRTVVSVAPLRGAAVLVASVSLSTLLVVSSATAQSNIFLPTLDVVSATLVPTPSSQVGSSVTVITAEDIQREQRRTVPDALQAVPGLNVVQSGGPGGATSVFIRGTASNHVKVLVDGIDIGDPTSSNGAVDFAHLLAGDIERIEVLRGPQSGLYGSDAIGGVISITTKRGEGPLKATGMVEAGSFKTFNQTAGLSGSKDNVDYAFNVSHFRSDSTPVMPLRFIPPGQLRLNNGYNNWTYSANVGAKLNDELSLRFIGRYTQAALSNVGLDFINFNPAMAESALDTRVSHNGYTRGEAVWSPFTGLKNIFGISYISLWNRFTDPNPDSGFVTPPVFPPFTNLGQRTKVDWRGEAQVSPGQTLVMGLEHQRETLRTDTSSFSDFVAGTFTQTTTNAKTGNTGAFVELQSEFDKQFFLVSNVRFDNSEDFGGHATWRVAPAYIVPLTDTKLKASYGTGFKAPTLSQLFVSFPSTGFGSTGFFGNPDLKPEKSVGYDIGFEQPFWNKRVQAGATYFHNNVKDMINATPTTWENTDKANIFGYEAFVAWNVREDLRLRSDYTYTHVEATSNFAIVRRVPHKYSLTSTWNPITPLQLSGTLIATSHWLDFDSVTGRPINQRGYTTANIAANYTVNEHLTAFTRVDNLFNARYEEPNGLLRPGLAVYAGARVTN